VKAVNEERDRMKPMIQNALGKYGKPRLALKELRSVLDTQIGSTSLSQEIIALREEGC
jgi:hypothetical protein